MTFGFGNDFRAAMREPQYQARNGQSLWLAIGLTVAALIAYLILQNVFAFVMLAFMDLPPGVPSILEGLQKPETMMGLLAKSAVVGLLPAALLGIVIVWLFTKIGNPSRQSGMPLHVPKLGVGGWSVTLISFVLVMVAFFLATYIILGIDPKTYSPNDPKSMSGMVEKAVADLADEPIFLAMAIPGIALVVPILEELMFRGPLFATLRQSRVGPYGAVVLTAAAWALIHMSAPWLFIFVIFFMGLALGWMLLRFGSITVTIAAHCLWNLMTTVVITSGMQS
jgi:membrane protease YdiL (CAAX protease family)